MKKQSIGEYVAAWVYSGGPWQNCYPGGDTPTGADMQRWIDEIRAGAAVGGMEITSSDAEMAEELALAQVTPAEYFGMHPDELDEAIGLSDGMTIEDVVDGVREFAAEMFFWDITGDVGAYILAAKVKGIEVAQEEE